MIHRYTFVLLFFISFLTGAQNIILTTCNEIKNSSARNQCLEASLENLLIKEVFRNLDLVNLQPEQPVNMIVGINVSKTGIFAINSISTPNFGLARSIHNVLKTIKPLDTYRDENRATISSNFEFDFSFVLKKDNSIAVQDKNDKIIFIKRFKTEKEKKEEKLKKQTKSDTTAKPKKQLKNSDDVAYAVIEQVPLYPGCEDLNTNEERKECMSDYISSMVINNFNSQLANNLGLSGRQRISVQFKIDTNGFIIDVLARAPHPALEEEAIRVINTLPRVIPGEQRGQKVNVMYSLPILFQVEGHDTKKK